jgi:ABC-type nitrate/sulfonate/bicarbonate transport system ATPase subunit
MSTHSIKQSIKMACHIITLNNKKIKMECHVIKVSQTHSQNEHAMSSYSIKQLTFATHITIANQNLSNQNTTFDIYVTFED